MPDYAEQVIIVGAGPVGLMTAFRLSAFGIPCAVIERLDRLPDDLRASTFHPPTLDMLSAYGLTRPLIDDGLVCPSWQIRMHDTGERVVFDLSLLASETAHPYRLQCEQFRLSRLLYAKLSQAPNVQIHMGAALERIEQSEDGVIAYAKCGGEDMRLTGRFLVGADGARSTVRELLGFGFEGKTYPETTLLATTSFPFEEHLAGLSNVNYVWWKGGTFSLLRLPRIWRCSLYPDDGESIDDAAKPESVQRKLQRIVPTGADYPVLESRPYRVHMRLAVDYRKGRVVLAGDAAHINSPSGGMGMNGGIHDAFNLTAKLKDIFAGSDLGLLDRYTRQRRPIAESEILSQADRNRARMQERDPERRRIMFDELRRTVDDPELAKAYLLRSSMIAGLRRSQSIG